MALMKMPCAVGTGDSTKVFTETRTLAPNTLFTFDIGFTPRYVYYCCNPGSNFHNLGFFDVDNNNLLGSWSSGNSLGGGWDATIPTSIPSSEGSALNGETFYIRSGNSGSSMASGTVTVVAVE